MNQRRIAENLAAVEAHFHSEAENEVAAALKLYTDDIVWEAPALNGLNRSYSGKEEVAENYRQLWASMRDVKFTFLQRPTNPLRERSRLLLPRNRPDRLLKVRPS
jgi:hypothetical protein